LYGFGLARFIACGIQIIDLFETNIVVLLDEGVEPVFDFIFGSAKQVLADFGPLTADFAVQFEHFPIFFLTPFFLLDPGVQFVDEPFADLLAVFRAQHFGEKFPVFAVLLDKFADGIVLLSGPYFMAFAELGKSAVAVETLVVVAVDHLRCDFSPFLWKSLIEFEQLVVLFAAPGFDLAFGDLQVFLPHLHVDLSAVLRQEGDHEFSLHFFYKL
jgi:hypothetical protein